MEPATDVTPSKKRKPSTLFLVMAGIIAAPMIGWQIWTNWPAGEVDQVALSARKTSTVEDVRRAFNALEAPKDAHFMYGQAVASDGDALFYVEVPAQWGGRLTDATKLSLDDVAVTLANVLAIMKVTTFQWSELRFEVRTPSGYALQVHYSPSDVRKISIAGKSTKQLFDSGSNYKMVNPAWHWKADK